MEDDLYREIILDHYKNPPGHGAIDDADAAAEGQNPLSGDEVSIYVQFEQGSDVLEELGLKWLPGIGGCPLDGLPPGSIKIVHAGLGAVCVYNLDGELYGLEDRCSHDDGPLCEGDFDSEEGVVVCPRHGANFDIRTGEALTLPAFVPVATYPVRVDETGMIKVTLA